MEQNLIVKLLLVLLIVFAVRTVVEKLYDPSVYNGPWYRVRIPEGWEKEQLDDEVRFSSPETDDLYLSPQAVFSIYGTKSEGALFAEDFFPEVLAQLAQVPGQLLDQGQLKVGGYVSYWTLFRNADPDYVLLTFYVIDDFNRLTKIQYITRPEYFPKYRSAFDAFRDSFIFKGLGRMPGIESTSF